MNKKGFTLIELITTFALTSVIIILLINVVLLIKDIYMQNYIKSSLIIEQSNLSYFINNKFLPDSLEGYRECDESDFCYEFDFNDGTTSKLLIKNNSIKFDNYVYDLSQEVSIENPKVEMVKFDLSNTNTYNSVLVIDIPIKSKLYKNDNFGINVIYQFNSYVTSL